MSVHNLRRPLEEPENTEQEIALAEDRLARLYPDNVEGPFPRTVIEIAAVAQVHATLAVARALAAKLRGK